MTNEEIAAAEALCAAATPGPWFYEARQSGGKFEIGQVTSGNGVVMDNEPYYPEAVAVADMKFCAAARTLVPKLVAEVKRLKANQNSATGIDATNPQNTGA